MFIDFRNTRVYYDKIESVISYCEKEKKYPTLIFTKLPNFKRDNDNLGRIVTTRILLDSIENKENNNLLKRLFNVCRMDCMVYIFTTDKKLVEDIDYMTRVGFTYQNLLVYKTKATKKRGTRLFSNNTGYILFFTKDSNYLNHRYLNKVNNEDNTTLLELTVPKVEVDYPKNILRRLLLISKLDKLDENLIIDLQSELGNVPKLALEYNMECVCFGKSKKISNVLNMYLTGIEKKPKKQKEIIQEKIDYTERNKKISQSMKKNNLKEKIMEVLNKKS